MLISNLQELSDGLLSNKDFLILRGPFSEWIIIWTKKYIFVWFSVEKITSSSGQ